MANNAVWQRALNGVRFTMTTGSGLAMKNMHVIARVKIAVVSDRGALQ